MNTAEKIKVDCKWCKHEGVLYQDIRLEPDVGFVCIDQAACDQRDADANPEEDCQ
jgi:hypothetical protein